MLLTLPRLHVLSTLASDSLLRVRINSYQVIAHGDPEPRRKTRTSSVVPDDGSRIPVVRCRRQLARCTCLRMWNSRLQEPRQTSALAQLPTEGHHGPAAN